MCSIKMQLQRRPSWPRSVGEENGTIMCSGRGERNGSKQRVGRRSSAQQARCAESWKDLRITWPSWSSMQRSFKSSTFFRSVHKMSNTRFMSGFFPSSNFLTWYPVRKTVGWHWKKQFLLQVPRWTASALATPDETSSIFLCVPL